MTVLVFGANGLLGSHICALFPDFTIPLSHTHCDIMDRGQVRSAIKRHNPFAVINCAGVVKGRTGGWEVNSDGPKRIAEVCSDEDVRLVHVSTDCVFSGLHGPYDETSQPTPDDEYGESKLDGEISYLPHLTVRTSFVGWPDPQGRGLLHWFVNSSDPCQGYVNALWNGLTTVALAEILVDLAYSPDVTGLRHVFGEDISKYDLLKTFSDVYRTHHKLEPFGEYVIDRRLRSIYNDVQQTHQTFVEMVEEMRGVEWKIYKYLSQSQ